MSESERGAYAQRYELRVYGVTPYAYGVPLYLRSSYGAVQSLTEPYGATP